MVHIAIESIASVRPFGATALVRGDATHYVAVFSLAVADILSPFPCCCLLVPVVLYSCVFTEEQYVEV